MNREDLFKMLDIKPKAIPVAPDHDLKFGTDEPEPYEGELSETVLHVDDFDLEQGEVLGGIYPLNLKLADFFNVSFAIEPELHEACVDPLRQQFVQTLLESPAFLALRESTRSNVHASRMAAADLGREFAKLEETEDDKAADRQNGPTKADKEATEAAVIAATARAVSEAADKVDELTEALRALGGAGPQEDQNMDPDKVAALFQRVQNNPTLKRICELAGRYRRVAQSQQRQKTKHGYDDMVGVELSGDVGRLLPLEMALLADEDFELDAMRRLVEKQMMSREYRGVEPQGRGPIVICVDESGSMSGEPVANAKAFALAMAWIAKHQKRWCCLIGYAGGSAGTLCCLPPGKWNEVALMDWLCHFYSGGTTMDVPLHELPTNYWSQIHAPKGKTDVILITDGIVRVPSSLEATFNAWKKAEQVKCISIVIGSSGGELNKVSDEVHTVSGLNLDQNAVTKCLGV